MERLCDASPPFLHSLHLLILHLDRLVLVWLLVLHLLLATAPAPCTSLLLLTSLPFRCCTSRCSVDISTTPRLAGAEAQQSRLAVATAEQLGLTSQLAAEHTELWALKEKLAAVVAEATV